MQVRASCSGLAEWQRWVARSSEAAWELHIGPAWHSSGARKKEENGSRGGVCVRIY